MRRLLGLARPYAGSLAAACLLSLLSTGASLSLPVMARSALDQALRTHQAAAVDRFALELLGLIVLMFAASFGEYVLVAWAGQRVVRDLRARLFAQLQRMPVPFFDRTSSGGLVSCLSNDVTVVQQTLLEDIVRVVGSLFTLLGGLALAVYIDARLTAIVAGLLAATLGTLVVVGLRVRRLARETQEAVARTMGSVTEALANVRLVKAFAREVYEDRRVGDQLARVLRLGMRTSVFEAGTGALAQICFIAALIGVFWYGGRGVLAGRLTAGSLLAFLMTIAIIGGPMVSLAGFYARLQRASGAGDRIFALLDGDLEPPDPPAALPFPAGPGSISFVGVTFGYTADAPVLRDFSVELPAGRVTALVGRSGSGKTTVANLLYRFYEPQAGEIRIDGVPIPSLARTPLRERIGIVPQEPVLFEDTIRENIRFGRLDATDREVEAAAAAANAAEFIEELPAGYDTLVGERGITLSGGQRQRIAIARAVLKDPRILVLDEATSALDARSERLVREALARLRQGRTTLVIAHRLTTVRDADQIAVIEGGRIVERGTHEDLLRRGGRYAALYGTAGQPPNGSGGEEPAGGSVASG